MNDGNVAPHLIPWRTGRAGSVRVWDAAVRGFHWLLAGSVLGAAYTGFFMKRLALQTHLLLGIAVALLVLFRLVWGLCGPTYARFASFAHPPRALGAHLRALAAGRGDRHLGHNPLGALMVFALLLVLAALVFTGAGALGGVLKQGPLAAFMSYAAGRGVLLVHGGLTILLLAMIALHLGGVAFESRRSGENLVRAMVTGDKPVLPAAHRAAPARPRPVLAAAALAAGGLLGGAMVAALSALPARGMPPARLDRHYVNNCDSCHMAYPPSLASAATWRGIMTNLTHHFGEDASLGRRATARITAYLTANSTGHWDSLPAHLLRAANPADPLRITATAGWRRMHRHIAVAVFRAKAVRSRAACSACHADAKTGRFAPQNIHIPQTAMP